MNISTAAACIYICISTTVVYVCTHVPLPLQQYRVPDLNLWRGLLLRSRKRRLRRIPVHLPCRSLHQLSTAASVNWLLHENVAGAFSCVCIATTGTASYACSASVVSSRRKFTSVKSVGPLARDCDCGPGCSQVKTVYCCILTVAYLQSVVLIPHATTFRGYFSS